MNLAHGKILYYCAPPTSHHYNISVCTKIQEPIAHPSALLPISKSSSSSMQNHCSFTQFRLYRHEKEITITEKWLIKET